MPRPDSAPQPSGHVAGKACFIGSGGGEGGGVKGGKGGGIGGGLGGGGGGEGGDEGGDDGGEGGGLPTLGTGAWRRLCCSSKSASSPSTTTNSAVTLAVVVVSSTEAEALPFVEMRSAITTSQPMPVYGGRHSQMPLTHWPRPRQPIGQYGVAQALPDQPEWQTQAALVELQ